MSSALRLVLAACALALSTSCISISSTTLDGSDLRYPVSFSQSVVGPDGTPVVPSEVVGPVEREWTHWGWLYDSVSLSSDEDLSAMLNGAIEELGGDGIVNLRVTAKGTGLTWLTSLLIIFPERVKVTVEGDVVRFPAP